MPTPVGPPGLPLPPLSHLLPELQPLRTQTRQAQIFLRAFVLAVLSAQNALSQDVLLAGSDVCVQMPSPHGDLPEHLINFFPHPAILFSYLLCKQ